MIGIRFEQQTDKLMLSLIGRYPSDLNFSQNRESVSTRGVLNHQKLKKLNQQHQQCTPWRPRHC